MLLLLLTEDLPELCQTVLADSYIHASIRNCYRQDTHTKECNLLQPSLSKGFHPPPFLMRILGETGPDLLRRDTCTDVLVARTGHSTKFFES